MLISDSRLPKEVIPNSYHLFIEPNPEAGTFKGRVLINVTWQENGRKITLNADPELQISQSDVTVNQVGLDDNS